MQGWAPLGDTPNLEPRPKLALREPPLLLEQKSWWGKIKWNYYKSMWMFCLLNSFIGGAALYMIEELPLFDCLFLATSAYTGTGLSVVEVGELKNESFVVLYILMNTGGVIFLTLPPMLFRVWKFWTLEPMLERFLIQLNTRNLQSPQVKKLIMLIGERRAQVRGLKVVLLLIATYLVCFLVFGGLIFYSLVKDREDLIELEARGISRLWYSFFMAASAFCNCGFSMTDDSIGRLLNQPKAYLFLAFLILAGNNLAPIFLRWLLYLAHSIGPYLGFDTSALKFALNHPRQMTTHLLDSVQTRMFIIILIVINLGQYAIFCASTFQREHVLEVYSKSELAGAGIFQTVSTRHAGLGILDLRLLNQGQMVIMFVMMYLSTAAFVSRMYVSEQTLDEDGMGKQTDENAKHALARFQRNYLFRHIYFLAAAYLSLAFEYDPFTSVGLKSSLFDLLFELTSAYGNVGLSMGDREKAYSLVGAMSIVGKVIIWITMLLGKHRGLPRSTDMTLNFRYKRLQKALKTAERFASGTQPHIGEQTEEIRLRIRKSNHNRGGAGRVRSVDNLDAAMELYTQSESSTSNLQGDSAAVFDDQESIENIDELVQQVFAREPSEGVVSADEVSWDYFARGATSQGHQGSTISGSFKKIDADSSSSKNTPRPEESLGVSDPIKAGAVGMEKHLLHQAQRPTRLEPPPTFRGAVNVEQSEESDAHRFPIAERPVFKLMKSLSDTSIEEHSRYSTDGASVCSDEEHQDTSELDLDDRSSLRQRRLFEKNPASTASTRKVWKSTISKAWKVMWEPENEHQRSMKKMVQASDLVSTDEWFRKLDKIRTGPETGEEQKQDIPLRRTGSLNIPRMESHVAQPLSISAKRLDLIR